MKSKGRWMKRLFFSNDLEWFRPYVQKVKNIVPIHQLEKIVSYKPRLDQVHHQHAQLLKETWEEDGVVKKRKYISINLYFVKVSSFKPLRRKIGPFSKIDLLELLAHELAHLTHWEHTPSHKALEARLKRLFMTQLEKTGYISEEQEMKYDRPKF